MVGLQKLHRTLCSPSTTAMQHQLLGEGSWSTQASQHTLLEHKRVHTNWRSSVNKHTSLPAQAASKRPVWTAMKNPNGRSERNSYHEFVRANYSAVDAEMTHMRQHQLPKQQHHRAVLRQLGATWRTLEKSQTSRISPPLPPQSRMAGQLLFCALSL